MNAALWHGLIRPFFRVITTCRKDAVVHATDELCGAFFPFIRGKKIVTVHHVIRPGEDSGSRYYRLWMRIARIAVGKADSVIAISDPTARDIRSTFHPDSPIMVIPNVVSPSFARIEGVERCRTVAVVAELIPRKNVSVAIEALSMMPNDVTMTICGRGQCRDSLEKQAEALGVHTRMTFVESIEEDDLIALYNSVAVVMSPSMHEGAGMTILEATRCGTPVLCLKDADIPKDVLACTVLCDGPVGMASEAIRLMNNPEEYAQESSRCMDASAKYGLASSSELISGYQHLM